MRDAAERLLAPQLRTIVRLIDEPLLQPIYDLTSPRLAFGRVAVIGDAAFVARPHVAAGVSKAADDAAALAAALDDGDVEDSLQRYEADRLPEGRRIIERARHLGAYLQASQSDRRGCVPPARAFRKPCLPNGADRFFTWVMRLRRASAAAGWGEKSTSRPPRPKRGTGRHKAHRHPRGLRNIAASRPGKAILLLRSRHDAQ